MKGIVLKKSKWQKTRIPPGVKAGGFTMIELLVTLAMVSILMVSIYSVYAGLTRSYTTQNVAADVQQVMRAGIDFMVEDIMMAGLHEIDYRLDYVNFPGIIEGGPEKIRVRADKNMDGSSGGDFEDITYEYFPGAKELRVTDHNADPVETLIFIDNVTDLSFVYRDAEGNPMGNPDPLLDPVPTAVLGDIRTVEISMKVEEPAGRGRAVKRTYTTRVMCRNFSL